jgi:hypothetical protein
MSENIHKDLMPLYLVGGVAAIAGVFYLLNKNVDKLTATLANNETLQMITDPAKVVEKVAYSAGWSFWDWYDTKYTDPYLAQQAAIEEKKAAQKEAEKRESLNFPTQSADNYNGDFSLSAFMGLGNSHPDTLDY